MFDRLDMGDSIIVSIRFHKLDFPLHWNHMAGKRFVRICKVVLDIEQFVDDR